MIDRRDFLKTSALASAGSLLAGALDSAQPLRPKVVNIRTQAPDGLTTRLAARELLSSLRTLFQGIEINQNGMEQAKDDAAAGAVPLTLAVDGSRFKGTEEYEVLAAGNGATLRGASDRALLFAVFDFLERQGLVFGLDGTTVPVDRPTELRLPKPGQPWTGSPRFAVRGLLPWPDFLNCISVNNDEDFKAYFAAMLRMRFNMFGMHVYTQNEPGPLAESYL